MMQYYLLTLMLSAFLSVSAQQQPLLLDSAKALEYKDSLVEAGWTYRTEFPYFVKQATTGGAPKSCAFSPDNNEIAVTLLNQKGIGAQFFDLDSLKKHYTLRPPSTDPKKNWGYAEGEYETSTGHFWITRMASGHFFVWDGDSLEQYKTKGVWTKILRFNPSEDRIAMSHWSSNTVTVFDVETRMFKRSIKTGKTPRGIAWINDSVFVVALFGTGDLQVYNAISGKKVYTIKGYGGAARDIEYDPVDSVIYYSNMSKARVYKYSWSQKKHIAITKVDFKPNTIRLTPDRRYLFVSCRGPNNKKGYTLPSPRDGDLYLIRTDDFSVVKKWRGGNQPTGMDISSDGKYLISTDFQDARLNLWLIAI